MAYPRRLLNDGEEIALDLKPHWWFFSQQALTGAGLLVLFVLVLRVNHEITWWMWGLLALVWAGWLAVAYLAWTFTHFVVTTDRVIYRTGVMSKRGVEIPLERVNNITFTQTILERLLGAGDLEIESAGESGRSTFDDVRHPDGVQQEIYRQMELHARKRASWFGTGQGPVAPAAPPPAPTEASIPEQIEQLAVLRDRGILSDQEFEAKKAQLLERM